MSKETRENQRRADQRSCSPLESDPGEYNPEYPPAHPSTHYDVCIIASGQRRGHADAEWPGNPISQSTQYGRTEKGETQVRHISPHMNHNTGNTLWRHRV